MIVVVDYGMGNVRSIVKKVNNFGFEAASSSNPKIIDGATKIIIPGVGHFAEGMKNLKEGGLIEILNKKIINEKVPVLGICLGMQLLTNHSEEGNCRGLGWIEGKTVRFDFKDKNNLRVPHIGWNNINTKSDSLILKDTKLDYRYYFTHSYFVVCSNSDEVIATTEYGFCFDSIIQKDNIYGTQFHPEKSHIDGFKIILNFLTLS
ncbi:MAG: imidazole glycerol phosphate synthase subunit HisH [Chloroflexi bacterium]|nr:imidazole glycerol phosphate synthase subunit HisH [Chloroflexota bacterium]|tara:strand:+ start:5 stop:619 length:615 start_codon:yes stop_codon:yes gene_type:complete